MDAKTQQLIEKIKGNAGLAQQLLSSAEGRKLLQLLSSSDGGAALQRSAQNAAKGNTADLAKMISSLMNDPEAAALMQRISEMAKK